MSTALDIVALARCLGCDGPGTLWCARCDGELRPFAAERPIGALGAAFALASYDSGAATALRRAKYGRDRAAMLLLAGVVAPHAAPLAVGYDALVPIPSPWTRRMSRGFAPATLLALAVARRAGVPVVAALRLAPGRRQAGLDARARRTNLEGRMRAVTEVPGRALLVDDVLTTGATAEVAARELLGGSTIRVDLLAVCATDAGRGGKS